MLLEELQRKIEQRTARLAVIGLGYVGCPWRRRLPIRVLTCWVLI